MTTLVTVPTGVTQTYKLIVDDDPGGTGNLTVYGKLTAVVIPFASDGSNPAITLGGSSQGTSGAPGAK
jgi:hypothetical protein